MVNIAMYLITSLFKFLWSNTIFVSIFASINSDFLN